MTSAPIHVRLGDVGLGDVGLGGVALNDKTASLSGSQKPKPNLNRAMFGGGTGSVRVASSADFGELPEGAVDIFAKDPPRKKGDTKLQRPPVSRKNAVPGRRALSPIKEESPSAKPNPVANDVLLRLKERSNERLRTMRRKALLEKPNEQSSKSTRKEGKAKKHSTSSTVGRANSEQAAGQTSKGRGETISSLVRRFRESPPLPKEQRQADNSSRAQGGNDFWWIEVGDNTSAQSSEGEIQIGRPASNTPSFFDIDNLEMFDADSVLAKSKQLTEDDAEHKEMLDRLCKKYLNSDEQPATVLSGNELDWSWMTGQGRAEPSLEEKETSDVLEKWRKRWKNEIDLSSPVKTAPSSDVDVKVTLDSLFNGMDCFATPSSIADFMDGSSQVGAPNSPVTMGGLEGLGFSDNLGELHRSEEGEECCMAMVSPEKQNGLGQYDWWRGPDEFGRKDSSDMDIDSPQPLAKLQSSRKLAETARCSSRHDLFWESGLRVSTRELEEGPMEVDDQCIGWKGWQNTSFFVPVGKPHSRWDRPPLPRRCGPVASWGSPLRVDPMDEDGRSVSVGSVVSTLVECTVTNFLFSTASAPSPCGSAMEVEAEGGVGNQVCFFNWSMD